MNDVLVIAQLDSSNEILPLEPVHIDLLCHHEMNQLKSCSRSRISITRSKATRAMT